MNVTSIKSSFSLPHIPLWRAECYARRCEEIEIMGTFLWNKSNPFFRKLFLKKREAAVVLQKNWRAYRQNIVERKVWGFLTSLDFREWSYLFVENIFILILYFFSLLHFFFSFSWVLFAWCQWSEVGNFVLSTRDSEQLQSSSRNRHVLRIPAP